MTLPYDTYPKIMKALDLIGLGRTRTVACDEAGISVASFIQHIKADAGLQGLLEEAEQRGYDALCDVLLSIDRDQHYGQSDPKMAAIISKNIQWVLSKRRPKEFGERVAVDINVTADKAIIGALERARNRTAALPSPSAFVDVTPVVIDVVAEEEDWLS